MTCGGVRSNGFGAAGTLAEGGGLIPLESGNPAPVEDGLGNSGVGSGVGMAAEGPVPDDAPPGGVADEGGSFSNALPEGGRGFDAGDGSGDSGADGLGVGVNPGGGGGVPSDASWEGGSIGVGEIGAIFLSSVFAGLRSVVLLLMPGKGIGAAGDPPNPSFVGGSSDLGAGGFAPEDGSRTGGKIDDEGDGVIGGDPDDTVGFEFRSVGGVGEDGGSGGGDLFSPAWLVEGAGGSIGIPVGDIFSVAGFDEPSDVAD